MVDQTMSAHAAVIAVAGWEKSLVEAWPSDADDLDGAWVVGAIDEDGNKYPVITVEADQYDAPGDSEKIARALIVLWAQAFTVRPAQTEQQPRALTDSDSVPDDYRNQASGYRAGWNDCLGIAAPIAQAATLPVQSGWISIEDRLPKCGQVIIVPRLNSTPFCGKYEPLGGQHWCLDRCLGKWWEFSRWMPMPNAGEARDV